MDVMRGYQLTDAGVIPEDWNAVRLADIGEALIGLTYSPADVATDGVLVLRSSNVQDGALCFNDNVFVTSAVPERIMVRQGDILICVRNGSRELIGKCARIDERAQGMTFGAFMAVFRTEDSGFIHQQFKSSSIQRQIREHLGATINQITNKSLNSFVVALPSLPTEREAIAEALADADALIESLEQLLAKKRQIKRGAMQELLTGRKRLPGFSDGWEVKRLGQLGRWTGGMTPSMANPSYWQAGTVPWISSGDVKSLLLSTTTSSVTDRAITESATTLLPAKSIVVVTRSGILRKYLPVAMSLVPMAINQDIKALLPNSDVVPEYLLHSLTGYGDQILARCLKSGTTVESIEFPWLKAFEIPVPPPIEQMAIAAILSDMDTELAALEIKLTKARQLKQGMMQELLTGRIRLV